MVGYSTGERLEYGGTGSSEDGGRKRSGQEAGNGVHGRVQAV